MPRQRNGEITESIYLLRQQEERYEGEPAELRVRAIRLMKENPTLTMAEIASTLGCTDRSIRRWWKEYSEGGLEALVAEKTPQTKALVKVGDDRIQELGRKLQKRELASLSDIQGWLKEECGAEYTIPGVWHLVRRTFKVERSWAPTKGEEWGIDPFADPLDRPVIPPNIMRFLNSLPLLGSLKDRVIIFREALQDLFFDIDKVVINVNYSFNFEDPVNYNPGVFIEQYAAADKSWGESLTVVDHQGVGNALNVLNGLRAQGYPLDAYHPAEYMEFRLTENAYLGTIFVFREIARSPISANTLGTLDSLESFLYFMLFDLAAQHQVVNPVDKAFMAALKQLAVEANLTIKERKVVIHQMLGCSYKEIADLLDITVPTLKKHVNTIHQKTGTRSQGELFAKYFSPRLGPVLTSINESV